MLVYCRVVNKSKVGETEQLVFQRQDNLEIIETETITKVKEYDKYRIPNITEDINYILAKMEHYCYIDYHDNGHHRHTLILE